MQPFLLLRCMTCCTAEILSAVAPDGFGSALPNCVEHLVCESHVCADSYVCCKCFSAVWASVLVKVMRRCLFVLWLNVLFVLCVVPVVWCSVVWHVD